MNFSIEESKENDLIIKGTRCFRKGDTGLPVVHVTENQKALNHCVLNYGIPVSE